MNAVDIFGKNPTKFFELKEEGFFPASLAQWKIFTPEEQALAEKADRDEDAKKLMRISTEPITLRITIRALS